jgi:hypothetical protein
MDNLILQASQQHALPKNDAHVHRKAALIRSFFIIVYFSMTIGRIPGLAVDCTGIAKTA